MIIFSILEIEIERKLKNNTDKSYKDNRLKKQKLILPHLNYSKEAMQIINIHIYTKLAQ
jgi:hypothetical protein